MQILRSHLGDTYSRLNPSHPLAVSRLPPPKPAAIGIDFLNFYTPLILPIFGGIGVLPYVSHLEQQDSSGNWY